LKKWLYIVGLSLAMATSAAVQAKVGVVNVGEIFQKMPEREAVAKQLDKEFAGRIAELKKLEKELQTDIQKFQQEGAKMKAADRTKLETTINTKREQFAKKAEAFENDNRRRQGEERNKLLSKIQKAVEGVAKQEKYTVIVDVNAVAFADPSTDITAKVMAKVK
jgi:outer membrane protein